MREPAEVARFVEAVDLIKEKAMAPAESEELIAGIVTGWRRQ
jgi:hypothetical protein